MRPYQPTIATYRLESIQCFAIDVNGHRVDQVSDADIAIDPAIGLRLTAQVYAKHTPERIRARLRRGKTDPRRSVQQEGLLERVPAGASIAQFTIPEWRHRFVKEAARCHH